MHIRDVTRKEVIKMALEALPRGDEGHAFVLVDVRNGDVEVISKTEEFEDWAANTFNHKKVIFGIKEEEAAGSDIEKLYKKYKHEICCTVLEITETYPHLK